MQCDVHYCPAKFEIEIQLVYRETKNNKFYYGVNELNDILYFRMEDVGLRKT